MKDMGQPNLPSALEHYKIEAMQGIAEVIEVQMTFPDFEWVGDVPMPSSKHEPTVHLHPDQATRMGNALMVIARTGRKAVDLRQALGGTRRYGQSEVTRSR